MKKDNVPKDSKPDLKHDSMEYAASTDGDDRLDMDTESMDEIEEEDISAEELSLLEVDPDELAAALNSAEIDRQADNDVSFENSDEEEEPEESDDDREVRR